MAGSRASPAASTTFRPRGARRSRCSPTWCGSWRRADRLAAACPPLRRHHDRPAFKGSSEQCPSPRNSCYAGAGSGAASGGRRAFMGGTLSKGDYLGQFEAEGYAVLRGVFTAGEAAEMAAAFDRIQARALAGGRSWRDRNTFFLLGDDEKLGRVLSFAQWPAWLTPALDRKSTRLNSRP